MLASVGYTILSIMALRGLSACDWRNKCEGSVRSNELSACVKIAACICAKDGVISEAELQKISEVLPERFPGFDVEEFEKALDYFFDSDDQIEDFLSLIGDEDLRLFTLRLSELSAAADGLDPRENIALEKAYVIWGVNRNV